jgi:ATP-binding cassette subfamily B protein
LQRFKRDLIGLNFYRETVIELISKMRQEKFTDVVPTDLSQKMIVTIFTGEIVVQVDDGERPFHLMTLSAGDTTLVDWSETHLKYLPQGAARVWVATESEWSTLTEKQDFNEFLELFKKKTLRDHRPDFSEKSLSITGTAGLSRQKEERIPFMTASSQSSFKDFWWKLRRPSLLGSVDENRTGTALLIFLMKQVGISVQHRDIDAKVPDEWNDTTLLAFQAKCKKTGVTAELANFSAGSAMPTSPYVIVQIQSGFCLISSRQPGVWTLADFSSGAYREIRASELNSELKVRKCLIVRRIENIFPPPQKEFKMRHVIRFLKADPSLLTFLFLGSFLGFLTDLSVPVFSQYILDQVVTSGHVALLNPLILIFALLTVLGILISWFNQTHNAYLTNVLALRMKAFFQGAIFKLNPNVIHTMGASQLLSRITDIDQLAGFMVNQCFGSALAVIFMVGNLSVLWMYSPKLVALVFTLLPIGALITFLMRGRIENLKLEQVRTKARENRLILEHFSSNDDMRTLKGTLPSRWKWDFNSSLFARNLMSNQKLQAFFQIVQLTGSEGVKMGAFFYALHLYMNAQMSLGQVIAVVMIIPRVTDPIQGIVSMIYQYYGNKILVTRLNDLIAHSKTGRGDYAKYTPNKFEESLKFENVSLQYERESVRQILKDISFEIRHGEKVAFMGNTGSGKSSLSYLMAGLYEPSAGRVLYDNLEKAKVNPREFYSKVALVEQEGRLFAGSILDNIALGDEHPDLEHAVRCAKAVVMDDDILARPGGYGSMLLHGGVGLSEGQRQRLLIARALYKNPQILILDESTSYLDPISEAQVIKNIWEMMKDKTVIFFTQRVQITSRVDRVFFMENGQLLEQGSHKELIQSKQRYFDFYLRHLSIG